MINAIGMFKKAIEGLQSIPLSTCYEEQMKMLDKKVEQTTKNIQNVKKIITDQAKIYENFIQKLKEKSIDIPDSYNSCVFQSTESSFKESIQFFTMAMFFDPPDIKEFYFILNTDLINEIDVEHKLFLERYKYIQNTIKNYTKSLKKAQEDYEKVCKDAKKVEIDIEKQQSKGKKSDDSKLEEFKVKKFTSYCSLSAELTKFGFDTSDIIQEFERIYLLFSDALSNIGSKLASRYDTVNYKRMQTYRFFGDFLNKDGFKKQLEEEVDAVVKVMSKYQKPTPEKVEMRVLDAALTPQQRKPTIIKVKEDFKGTKLGHIPLTYKGETFETFYSDAANFIITKDNREYFIPRYIVEECVN